MGSASVFQSTARSRLGSGVIVSLRPSYQDIASIFLLLLGSLSFPRIREKNKQGWQWGNLYILILQVDNVDRRVKLVKLMHFLS